MDDHPEYAGVTSQLRYPDGVIQRTCSRIPTYRYLILTQTLHSDMLGGDLILKLSAKNLTNTPRRIVYDPQMTAHRIPEREYKFGRDYKLTLTWAF